MEKEPRKQGPDLTVPLRPEGTTVQECGDSSVVGNGLAATARWVENSGKESDVFEELFIHGGRWKLPTQRTKIGDYVKHTFSEHNQEADHLASLGADGTRKITVEESGNHERWKAVREFWDGSNKKDGTCGCGIVIKGVERKKWITIRKIAVPLEVCSGLSAGACIMTGILNLVLKKKNCVLKIMTMH